MAAPLVDLEQAMAAPVLVDSTAVAAAWTEGTLAVETLGAIASSIDGSMISISCIPTRRITSTSRISLGICTIHTAMSTRRISILSIAPRAPDLP